MIKAMEILDTTAKKVLFIQKHGVLVAAITDGDIRRWILSNGSLEVKVKDIANYSPLYLHESERTGAKKFMLAHSIEAVPIVDDNKRILSIVLLNEKDTTISPKMDIPVVIMAGGFGKRLYPYTKILPKPLIPIGEIPIVEHIINRFNKYGIEDFFLVVNHKKNMIKAYFNEIEKKYKVNYVDEDYPLGTGGGLSLLKGKINSTFILSNCDILIEEDYDKIFMHHKKERNIITMVCSLKNIKIPYGVVEINENGTIEKIKEKPELTFFTNTGMYVVEPRVIDELTDNEAIDFPNIIEKYNDKHEKIGVYPIGEKAWLDMGQLDEMEKMRERLDH